MTKAISVWDRTRQGGRGGGGIEGGFRLDTAMPPPHTHSLLGMTSQQFPCVHVAARGQWVL